MSIKREDPNTGDKIYRRQVQNTITPSGQPMHDYSDDLPDYSDDTPDYSNYDDDDSQNDNIDESQDNATQSSSSANNRSSNKSDARERLKKSERDYDNESKPQQTNKKSDVAKRERQNNYSYKGSGKKGGGIGKGNFFQNHKKGLVGGLLGTFVFGGMMSGSMIMSGTMQFMQIGSMISKTYYTVVEIQHAWRRVHNLKKMLSRGKTSAGKGIAGKEGEVGLLGSTSSKGFVESMEKIGAKVKPDGSIGVDPEHIEVNWECSNKPMCVKKQAKRKLGGKAEYYKVDLKNHTIDVDMDSISGGGGIRGAYRRRRYLSDLGRRSGMMPPGKYSATRATGKAKQFLSVFHPLRTLKNIIHDRVKDLVGAAKDVLKQKLEKTKLAQKAFDIYSHSRILGVDVSEIAGKFFALIEKAASMLKVGAPYLMAASIICKTSRFKSDLERRRWDDHVIPAMRLATEETATSSQIQAGTVDMTDLGEMSKRQFYNEYSTNSPDPNEKPSPSSWWDSAPINAELNQSQGMSDSAMQAKKNKVLPQLKNVSGSDSKNIFGDILNGAINITAAVACPISDFVDSITNAGAAILDAATNHAVSNITNATIGQVSSTAMNLAMDLITGKPLDLTNQTPEQFGNIAAYGAKFMGAQNSLRGNGGTVLSDTESAELHRDANIWLAMEWNDKPMLAKLFDPTDYRSAISTLARNARLDPNPENFLASIRNTFKLVAAVPNTALAMAVDTPVATAHAASGRPAYDYGIPDLGIVPSTFNTFNLDNEKSMDAAEYSIFKNARFILRVFWSEDDERQYIKGEKSLEDGPDGIKKGMPLGGSVVMPLPKSITDPKEIDRLIKIWQKVKDKYLRLIHICLAKNVDDKGDVSEDHSQNQANGGHTFMYLIGSGMNHDYVDNDCKGKLTKDGGSFDELLARIANYAGPDVSDVRTNQCLVGDKSDSSTENACRNAGFDPGNDSGGNSKTGSDGSSPDGPLQPGGVPSSEMAKRFVKDTLVNEGNIKYRYSANGSSFNSRDNGCTMVPFWFITKYTTLNACNGKCGNGGVVAENLAAANGLGKPTNVPRPYSIFSSKNGAMSSTDSNGHTGLVTKVDSDGTIHTLEVWFSDHEMHERTYKPSDYNNKGDNVKFVYVGDHLKGL